LLFVIRRGNKRLLWAHDTARLPEATFAALTGLALDSAVFDCTHGAALGEFKNHMSIPDVIKTVERLREENAVTPNTCLVANHFSHNGLLLHAELEERFAPFGIAVAYDGLTITL